MPTVFCTRCGQENPEDSRFCARCGAPLTRPGAGWGHGEQVERSVETTSTISISGIESLDPEHPDDPQIMTDVAIDGLPADSALLVVKRGPNAGSRFLLDKDLTTAGRHPESDIFLDDVTVSPRHAEYVRTDTNISVRAGGTPSSGARTPPSTAPTSADTTAPTSTVSSSTTCHCTTATRPRSASSA